MAEATTSRHESNYIKIAMVVLRVSPRAVRLQFDKEFHPNCLQTTLNSKRGLLLDLKMEKRITQPQWEWLFPTTGEPSSKDFDITLMICLLRNLIPIGIMDSLPAATDTSLAANLSRIKYYRNMIVHCNSALVDDAVFKSYWKDITQAILSLGGNSFKVECDDWYGRKLDAKERDDCLKCINDEKRLALVEKLAETNKKQIELEQEKRKELVETNKKLIESEQEQSKELAETKKKQIEFKQEQSKELAETNKKLIELEQEKSKELAETKKKLIELEQEQSNPVPKNIREKHTKEIESWKKDCFFKTSAVTTILEEVRNKSFVVITGPSGMGKSTIAKLVALQLQKTDDYHILPVKHPQDIERYFDSNVKQIYIIDDICGKFSVDQYMINLWENVNSQILKYCKDNKDFRVLGTCRLQISISSPFRKLQNKFEMTECNLLQENFLYSKEEKLNIAACHINEETIKEFDDKILSAHDMFPLLCKMYAASESNPDVRLFFEYPLQSIEEELDKMSEQNESCFIGLALIVIYNSKLYKHLLQNKKDKKFKDVFEDVFQDLGLENQPAKSRVLLDLQTLEGNYTKELESTITVIHDKIFDILSLYFGKRIPETILTHCSGTFIAERFLFESVKEDCDELKIDLTSDLEHSYFNRMVEEIENNRFYNVFKNVQVHNELYQEKFILFLSEDKHQSIIQKLLYNRWPLYLSAVKGCKLLVEFILKKKGTSGKSDKQDKDGNHQDMLMDKSESDMYACSFDLESTSRSRQFKFKYDNDDDDECTTGEDAYRIKFEDSPMGAACEGGYIDIVECLVKYGYNIDRSDTKLPMPLFSACKYGNKEVVDFLLKRNCKVDAVNANGQIALHAACKNGNIDIVNNLLKCDSSVNLCDLNGYTPLDIACIKGHTDVVQILLDNNCDIHGSKHMHGVPVDAIHIACIQGYKDIVEILIKHNVDINLHSRFQELTPIQFACLYGHTDIVKLLLDNNVFSPALHSACEGGYVEIVDLLLRNNCNINQCQPGTNKSPLIVACEEEKKACQFFYSFKTIYLNIDHFNHNVHKNGQADIVKLLLSYEACDVNIIDDVNRNALHYACRNGQDDVVELLLKHHCNVNQCDKAKKTPLFMACESGNVDIVKMLINQYNCMMDVLDVEGNGLLHATCGKSCQSDDYVRSRRSILYVNKTGRVEIIRFLLGKSCDVNVLNNEGQSVLHAACEYGDTEIVDILLRNNSNVNQCDKAQKTPLFMACESGNVDIVKMLINQYNCMTDVLDVKGNGLLHATYGRFCRSDIYVRSRLYATKTDRVEIIRFLLGKSCDVNVLNNEGQSVLHAACKYGDTEIVDILLRNNSNVNQCDKAMKTPLFMACESGNVDIVKMLLSYEACDVNIIDDVNRNALHYTCRNGQDDVVELLLKHHCNVNLNDKWMKTPLFMACESGNVDIVKMLLSYEACDVNIIDDVNRNALHYACRNGQDDVVELLLKHHCNVNLNDKWMKTPLFVACESGNVDIVKMLINQDNCMTDVLDVEGNGLLHATCGKSCRSDNYVRSRLYATKTGRVQIIRFVLGKSCDVYVLNNEGQSVLHAACKYGDTEIVDILLRNNSNVNQCDKAKKTPLFIACEGGYINIVKLLIESKCEIFNHSINGQTVLHAVCSGLYRSHRNYWKVETFTEGHKDILTLLIDKGCDVNKSDNNSQTPLHIACYKGIVALVKILLANNCVVDQCDDSNKTPFFLACEEGHKEVVKSLMNYNCNMDIRDKIGRSALHAVCTTVSMYPLSNREDIAELLINKRCGVYDLDDAGHSALHAACKLGNQLIVKLLLENKLDVDLRYKMGETPILKRNSNINQCNKLMETPLILAVEGGHTEVVELLVENKCDIDICDADGQTPLHRACSEGYADIAEIFLKRNSNINQCIKLMETPLILAVEGGHTEVVELLVENKCDIDICDADGQSPLHRACSEGYADIAEIFLKRNSNINQCNKLMKTPLILAVEGGHTEVVKLLVENKCGIDIYNRNGRTSLDIAVEKQFVYIESILLYAIENTNAHDACTE